MGSVVDNDGNVLQDFLPTEEEILEALPEEAEEDKPLSLAEYLASSINLDVPREVLVRIMIDRDVEPSSGVLEVERRERDLCKADLYVWACMGVSRRGEVRDTDNGWTHADGGYTLSADDKKLLLRQANDIYSKYDEPAVGKTKIGIRSYGIRKADTDMLGNYRGRVIK